MAESCVARTQSPSLPFAYSFRRITINSARVKRKKRGARKGAKPQCGISAGAQNVKKKKSIFRGGEGGGYLQYFVLAAIQGRVGMAERRLRRGHFHRSVFALHHETRVRCRVGTPTASGRRSRHEAQPIYKSDSSIRSGSNSQIQVGNMFCPLCCFPLSP